MSQSLKDQAHLEAVSNAQANAAMSSRNLQVALWLMGRSVKALMDECWKPSEIAAHTGLKTIQLYSALTVFTEYPTVQDIPND